MKRVLKHELFKLFNSLTLKILIIVIIGLAILNTGVIILMSNLMPSGDMPQGVVFALKGKLGAIQTFSDFTDLSIFAAILVSVIVVYDINSQTIKNTMISDIPRGKIFLAKYITEITAVCILFLINTIFTTGVITLFLGWGGTFTFASFWQDFILVTILGLLIFCALTAFINFFAYITKNTVLVIVIVFALAFILTIIDLLSAAYDIGILDFINKLSVTAVLKNYYFEPTFINLLYFIICFCLLFFPFLAGGYAYFQKQEIK